MFEKCHENQAAGASQPKAGAKQARYEIRVRDHLDPCWWSWFEGWSLTNLDDGVVALCRSHVDQSALHGALNKVRDLNLTLLSVNQIEE